MEIDCGENVRNVGGDNVKLREQFNLATRGLQIDTELPGRYDKVLLKNLE